MNLTKEEQEKKKEHIVASRTKDTIKPTSFDPREEQKIAGKGQIANNIKEDEKLQSPAKKIKMDEPKEKDVQTVLNKIKQNMISQGKIDTMNGLLTENQGPEVPGDDFMTRCAHRGLR